MGWKMMVEPHYVFDIVRLCMKLAPLFELLPVCVYLCRHTEFGSRHRNCNLTVGCIS